MRGIDDWVRWSCAGRDALRCACVAGTLLLGLGITLPSTANEAQWIWSPRHTKQAVPRVACYFRKVFEAEAPVRVQATIAADDEYELYVNGRKVGSGDSTNELDEYNITRHVNRGRNVIAVKVVNQAGPTAALVARVFLREEEGGWVTYSTDQTWRTSLQASESWHTPLFNDRTWETAQSFGTLGETVPWDRPDDGVSDDVARDDVASDDVASDAVRQGERFRIAPEFEVQRVIDGDATGSLIAMAFNEFGHIVASRENGPLLLIVDTARNGIVDEVRVYCELVTNVQGILPLNGDVYVTGQGPEGNGLYCLSDEDRDGTLESSRLLVRFRGEAGEHAAHGLTLGPDGWIYIVMGNQSSPEVPYDPESPHRDYYEGDLVGPRYEDPGGQAVGVKAPGGVIVRTDLRGDTVQLVSGGLHNANDLAFNAEGELFVHDSGAESDRGMTWYRPTRVCHVTAGSEFGWRSGWAKWPDYYLDALPAIADTGRGTPTGAVFYNHHMFPETYRDALFLADRSAGRILVARVRRQGAGYAADTEVFLEGQPLNVTDLDVGPDGWLYFATGGRGTGGGIYRVAWKGAQPESATDPGTGIAPAIRQPQLQSAWARQQIARVQHRLGEDWGPMLLGVARSTTNPTAYRVRALDLMQLYGPSPGVSLLLELSEDKNEIVRAKAADLMGVDADDQAHDRLLDLLNDSDHFVRRKALEALVRSERTAPPETVLALLPTDDRFEAWSARRLLERIPADTWRELLFSADNHRVFNRGSLALLIAEPTEENATDVVENAGRLMREFISDRDFVDLLRVLQVAIGQGDLRPEQLAPLRDQLAEEFPAGDPVMNRELIRLLVFLQDSSVLDRCFDYLNSDVANAEKAHMAMYLRFLESGWTIEHKQKLLSVFAEAKAWEGGSSYPLYLSSAARDFARNMTLEESVRVLRRGGEWPDAALGALYQLPQQLNDAQRSVLQDLDRELDRELDRRQDPPSQRLMVGIVAVLARSGDEASMAYLREIWDRNPERREPVAMGLAQVPGGENWEYLIRSLPILENVTAQEVLQRLATVDRVPDDPEHIRQVILCGLRLDRAGAEDAAALLAFWTGDNPAEPTADGESKIVAWQVWFRDAFPDLPDAALPITAADSRWAYDELLKFVTSREGQSGDPALGALVFDQASCRQCHRYGDRGEALGPNLTSLTKRLTRKEIVQSLVVPSHTIAPRYAAKHLRLRDGREIEGLVAPGAPGELVVLTADGEKISVAEQDVDEILTGKSSIMPAELIHELELKEIADLFAYLSTDPAGAVAERPASSGVNAGEDRRQVPR
jgi:putative heme-binding domain-containing protein